ncbi:MAG: family 16 glycoside hydrolase [Vicinamibacteraceae bacterium]
MRQHIVNLAIVSLALTGGSVLGAAAKPERPGWQALFDGATMNGWKASEHPESWSVKDGMLSCRGDRAHLFYMGPIQQAQFTDFEAEFEVLTQTGANSGVYFHTAWQDSGWPVQGFEMQVNNHQPHFPGDSGDTYIENKKTGSLYGVRNAYKALARDNEWFTLKLRVQGPRVRIHVNDTLVVDYLEPEGEVAGLPTPLQKIGKGTFALQCHDGKSQVQYRRIAVHPLPPAPAPATRAPNPDPAFATRYRLARDNFPLVDLRALDVKDAGTLEAALAAARGGALFVGVTASAGKTRTVKDDAGVDALVKRYGGKPLFLGLRADERGWAHAITPKALARLDFVLLDGETLIARLPKTTASTDPQAYGDAVLAATISAITREPIDIYGAPLFLPATFVGQRDAIWNEARQQQLIDALVTHRVAIEINGALQLPGEAFVRKAKAAGAKFTLGRCAVDTSAGEYCFGLREKVGLSWRDMYEPGHAPPRGANARPSAGVLP